VIRYWTFVRYGNVDELVKAALVYKRRHSSVGRAADLYREMGLVYH